MNAKQKLKLTLMFAALPLLPVQSVLNAATYTIPASTADQTVLIRNTVNGMASGDTLTFASGNHYISGWVDIYFNGCLVQGSGAVIRKIGGSNSGLNCHGNNNTFNLIEIDGGGPGTLGPCMVFDGGTGNHITNSKFHNSGNDAGLLLNNVHLTVVDGCECRDNYMVGISQSGSTDDTIKNTIMQFNGAEGLTIDAGSHNCFVSNCYIHSNNSPHRGVGGVGIDASNGANITGSTIDYNGNDGVCFKNNLNIVDDGCNIHNNQNISFNGQAAIGIYKNHLVTHLGTAGNTYSGNQWNGVHIYTQ